MTVRIMFKYVAFSGPHFPVFLFSPYSVQMWENTDQKKLPNGHFLHSEDVSNSIRGKMQARKNFEFQHCRRSVCELSLLYSCIM